MDKVSQWLVGSVFDFKSSSPLDLNFRLTPMGQLLQADNPSGLCYAAVSFGEPGHYQPWQHLHKAVKEGEGVTPGRGGGVLPWCFWGGAPGGGGGVGEGGGGGVTARGTN